MGYLLSFFFLLPLKLKRNVLLNGSGNFVVDGLVLSCMDRHERGSDVWICVVDVKIYVKL